MQICANTCQDVNIWSEKILIAKFYMINITETL